MSATSNTRISRGDTPEDNKEVVDIHPSGTSESRSTGCVCCVSRVSCLGDDCDCAYADLYRLAANQAEAMVGGDIRGVTGFGVGREMDYREPGTPNPEVAPPLVDTAVPGVQLASPPRSVVGNTLGSRIDSGIGLVH